MSIGFGCLGFCALGKIFASPPHTPSSLQSGCLSSSSSLSPKKHCTIRTDLNEVFPIPGRQHIPDSPKRSKRNASKAKKVVEEVVEIEQKEGGQETRQVSRVLPYKSKEDKPSKKTSQPTTVSSNHQGTFLSSSHLHSSSTKSTSVYHKVSLATPAVSRPPNKSLIHASKLPRPPSLTKSLRKSQEIGRAHV